MSFSRREFLHRGTLLAAGVMIPRINLDRGRGIDQDGGVPAAGDPSQSAGLAGGATGAIHGANLLNMTAQSFTPFVNSGFTVQVGPQAVSLILLSVTQLPTPPAPTNLASFAVMPPASYLTPIVTDAFALQFRGPQDLPQGSYTFRHPVLGEFALLIVPGNGQTYTGIINHLQSSIGSPAPPTPKRRVRPAIEGDSGSRRQ
jgi:hypothetical protein